MKPFAELSQAGRTARLRRMAVLALARYDLDFDDSLWCYPVQDIGFSLYYLEYHPDYRDLRAAFTRGYASVRLWPETGDGQVDTGIAARQLDLISLICHSDDPRFVAYLPTMLDKGVRRLSAWLEG